MKIYKNTYRCVAKASSILSVVFLFIALVCQLGLASEGLGIVAYAIMVVLVVLSFWTYWLSTKE